MMLGARVGMWNGGDSMEKLLENIRAYFSSSGTGVLDLTGLWDADHVNVIEVGTPNSGQYFRSGRWTEIILPNCDLNATYIFSSKSLKIVRCRKILATPVFADCPNLEHVYASGQTAEAIKGNTSWFPWRAPKTCTFHGNNGKKVIYDETTSAWVIVDEASAGVGGEGINA